MFWTTKIITRNQSEKRNKRKKQKRSWLWDIVWKMIDFWGFQIYFQCPSTNKSYISGTGVMPTKYISQIQNEIVKNKTHTHKSRNLKRKYYKMTELFKLIQKVIHFQPKMFVSLLFYSMLCLCLHAATCSLPAVVSLIIIANGWEGVKFSSLPTGLSPEPSATAGARASPLQPPSS